MRRKSDLSVTVSASAVTGLLCALPFSSVKWAWSLPLLGFPHSTSGKELACYCRRHRRCRFNLWVEKIPWRRTWQPTPVFLPTESHEERSLEGERLQRVGLNWSGLVHTQFLCLEWEFNGFLGQSYTAWKWLSMLSTPASWPVCTFYAPAIFGCSEITADDDCSHETKRPLLLGRKVMTNIHSMLKSRDITLPTKVHLVKVMFFPVVKYGCEIWTVKKAECWRDDAFELWCWRRLLRVPWTARRSNQSILKEISPEYSLEGMMLKLKLQYFGHLMWRTDSLEKTLMLGKMKAGGEGDNRGWDGWMASLTQWIWIWVNSGSWWWTGKPGVLQSMGSQRVR